MSEEVFDFLSLHRDFKIVYTAQWRTPKGEVKSAPRELPFRARDIDSAKRWALEQATSLSVDPDLFDFCLVLPDGSKVKLDVSGVVRANAGAPETLLEQRFG